MALHTIPFHASLFDIEVPQGMKVTNRHILLYGSIEVHSMGDLGCIASNKTFSMDTGLATIKISQYLLELKNMGWIDYSLGLDNKRSPIVPILKIVVPYHIKSDTLSLKKGHPLTKKVYRENIIDNIIEKNIDIPSQSSEKVKVSLFELFEEFYNLYPKHVDKKNALKSWEKAIKTNDPKMIIDNLSQQIQANMFSEEKKYIAAPAVWLNNERWENEIIQTIENIPFWKCPKEIQWKYESMVASELFTTEELQEKINEKTSKLLNKKVKVIF